MKTIFFLLCTLLTSTILLGQEIKIPHIGAKLYGNIYYKDSQGIPQFNLVELNQKKSFTLKSLSGGVMFYSKKGNIHEFEFTHLWNKKQTFGGVDEELFSISIRYELDYKLRIGEENKLKFYLGAGIRPFYGTYKRFPSNPDEFLIEGIAGGLILDFIPKINYHFTEKLFLDFSIPFPITSAAIDFRDWNNPLLSSRQQRTGGFDWDFFPGESVWRIGLGYIFGSRS